MTSLASQEDITFQENVGFQFKEVGNGANPTFCHCYFCENLGYQNAHSGRMFVPPLENREVYVLRAL